MIAFSGALTCLRSYLAREDSNEVWKERFWSIYVMESIEQRKSGMNKLKWYDFLGALILLFSVTKSAIKPPDAVDQANTLLAPSASTTINMDSLKVNSRGAALSQDDMLSPSMSGNRTRNVIDPELRDERMNGRSDNEAKVENEPTTKAIPKAAPADRDMSRSDQQRLGSFESTYLFTGSDFYLLDRVKLMGQ
jgi:hypothetical protein